MSKNRRPHLQDRIVLAFYDHYRAFRSRTLNQAVEEVALYLAQPERFSAEERADIERAISRTRQILAEEYVSEPDEEVRLSA